jgi:hypothetical protein
VPLPFVVIPEENLRLPLVPLPFVVIPEENLRLPLLPLPFVVIPEANLRLPQMPLPFVVIPEENLRLPQVPLPFVVIPEENLRLPQVPLPFVVIPEANLRLPLVPFCCHSRRESAFVSLNPKTRRPPSPAVMLSEAARAFASSVVEGPASARAPRPSRRHPQKESVFPFLLSSPFCCHRLFVAIALLLSSPFCCHPSPQAEDLLLHLPFYRSAQGTLFCQLICPTGNFSCP